jgi:hypothetical protein
LPRVWISYAHADEKPVQRIVRRLKGEGIEVAWDDDFLAGHMIQRQIIAAIKRCPKYIVVWSKHSLKRPWVSYELEVLREQRLRDIEQHAFDNCVIFYCLDGTRIPAGHSDDLCILEKKCGFESGVARLASSIKKSVLS